jgi:hypothetical protein
MYFYMYAGRLYWGRYGAMATQRNVYGWIFRNKTAIPGRIYISGPYVFRYKVGDFGLYQIFVSYRGGAEQSWFLPVESMFHLKDGGTPYAVDRHEEARALTARTFRNRLKEYKGKYFLPFHKHARCV